MALPLVVKLTRKQQHAKLLRQARKQYDQLLEAQDGHCALCPNVAGERRLHIDHDHARMVVRGLLCFRCNRALPNYVSAAWLRAAADYIERAEIAEAA